MLSNSHFTSINPLRILAYNICGDHVHMVLACEPSKLSNIVQELKSMSSRAYHVAVGRTRGLDPLPSLNHTPSPSQLWAQKFHRRAISTENYLKNAIECVSHNRYKHNLYDDPELKKISQTMICTKEEAFSMMEEGR